MIRKKTKSFIILLGVLFFLVIIYFPVMSLIKTMPYYRFKMYGDPIDLQTGMVNNAYFEIYSDGTNIAETTLGINNAIEYARKNNIEYIQFEKGTYIIRAFGDEDKRGVCIKSNMHINFNGSTIQEPRTEKTHYSIINLYQVENVIISNAIIEGDRENHKYEGNSTHEWGFGIDIRGSKNIEIRNVKITNTTGDGIYISKTSKYTTEDVLINSCYISDCRRQGITIISGKNIEIANCEICDIQGTNPQSGICIESNYSDEYTDNIKIHDNIIYNSAKNLAIHVYRGLYSIEIYNNEIYGDISFKDLKEVANIHDNILYNGQIIGAITDNLEVDGHYLNKIIIKENEYYNYSIDVDKFNSKEVI